jgi:hypothetical protein
MIFAMRSHLFRNAGNEIAVTGQSVMRGYRTDGKADRGSSSGLMALSSLKRCLYVPDDHSDSAGASFGAEHRRQVAV